MSTKIDKKSIKPDIAVSVIVPAYNASEYLDQCLDSIQGQSLKNFEVIVVNDASTDNSEEIIQKFVSGDKRFKLLSLETNRGLPGARNAGVELAVGEYMVHLDSDDFWLDSQTLDILYTTASLEHAQVLRFNGFDFINDNFGSPIIPPFPAVNAELSTTPQFWVFRSVFLYLFCTKFIREHQLSFDESIGIGEDAIFLSKALPKASRISSIPGFFYAYRRHPQSMMGNQWNLENFVEEQRASDIVVSNLQSVPEVLQWYVFSRYTDYWVNKLLPRAVTQLDTESRLAVYDRYRESFEADKSIYQPRSRVEIKYFIAQRLLMRGQFRKLDNFVIGLNKLKKFPGIYLGYYLDFALRLRRTIKKLRLKGINFLKRQNLVRDILSKREQRLYNYDSIAFTNDELHHDYDFSLEATKKKRGVTAMIRVKNEERNIVRCIESVLPYFDEILVVDNASTDRTLALVTELAKRDNNQSIIKIMSYPFAVARCGSEHAETSESSVHNLAYYYNWCLSQCTMSHVVKWDADMIVINSCIARVEFKSFLRGLTTETPQALGAFSVQTIYLDSSGMPFTTSEEIHSEVRFFPNEPCIHHKKGKDWEYLHHPRFRNIVRSQKILAYEIKDTREQEFDHWATNSFTGWRKSLEYRNYLLVQAGLQSPYRNFKPIQDIT